LGGEIVVKNTTLIVLSALLAACSGLELVPETPAQAFADVAPPATAEEASQAQVVAEDAEASTEDLTIVEVELAAAEAETEPEMVCRKEYRPGTRIVIGESCYPAGSLGVNTRTRDDIQRELSGRGMQAGWKSEQQINQERTIGLVYPRR
jgi:hypothetical protein